MRCARLLTALRQVHCWQCCAVQRESCSLSTTASMHTGNIQAPCMVPRRASSCWPGSLARPLPLVAGFSIRRCEDAATSLPRQLNPCWFSCTLVGSHLQPGWFSSPDSNRNVQQTRRGHSSSGHAMATQASAAASDAVAAAAAVAAPSCVAEVGQPPTQPGSLPDWHQQQQGKQQSGANWQHHPALPDQLLLLGIDPDCNGAIAVIRSQLVWRTPDTTLANGSNSRNVKSSRSNSRSKCNSTNLTTNSNGSSSSSTEEVPQEQAHVALPVATVCVYDMPVQTIPLSKKSKNSPQRFRRRMDIMQATAIVRQVLRDTAAEAETAPDATTSSETQPGHILAGHNSSTNGSSSTGFHRTEHSSTSSSSSLSLGPGSSPASSRTSSRNSRFVLHAVLEVASIRPTNGSLATLNQGYSVGAWTALLASHGFAVSTVHSNRWKKDLGLLGQDKDSSRALARLVFEQAGAPQDPLLRYKKDHGRAEALLLAAWGLGWFSQPALGGPWPRQGPLRQTLQMDGGMHSLLTASHQPQQQLVPGQQLPQLSAAARIQHQQGQQVTSNADSDEECLVLSTEVNPGKGALLSANLSGLLNPMQGATYHRILDVGSVMAADVAAAEAAAAAKQAASTRKAAARECAAAEKAAARAAAQAERAAARAAAKAEKDAARAAAKAAREAARAATKAQKNAEAAARKPTRRAAGRAATAQAQPSFQLSGVKEGQHQQDRQQRC